MYENSSCRCVSCFSASEKTADLPFSRAPQMCPPIQTSYGSGVRNSPIQPYARVRAKPTRICAHALPISRRRKCDAVQERPTPARAASAISTATTHVPIRPLLPPTTPPRSERSLASQSCNFYLAGRPGGMEAPASRLPLSLPRHARHVLFDR